MGSTGAINLDNIQGDILLDGLPKKAETFLFFSIQDAKAFCQKLKQVADEISHTLHTADARDNITNNKAGGTIVSTAAANIAFSFHGLQKMAPVLANLPLETQDQAFESGMKAGAASLHDPMKNATDPAYEPVFLSPQNIHGILIVAGSDDPSVSQKLQNITGIFGASIKEISRVSGKVRPGDMKGHEHFGFLDGVSEPCLQNINPTVPPGQDSIQPGVILCGRAGDNFSSRPAWMTDGSFLTFRKLEQKVPEWNKFLVDASNQLGTWSDQLGARLIGRWKSGCPVTLSPEFDDKGIAADPNQTNKFDFDANDNFRCPMGAHIRKMNPRGDLGRETVNQFRILRRGIPYGDEVDANPSGERGLLFVCYQSNIASGFQFLQQTWANNPGFSSSGAGLDAVMGQSNTEKTVDMAGLFPQDPTRPLALSGINRFVVPKGGEYFFSPSMSALRTTLSTLKRTDL